MISPGAGYSFEQPPQQPDALNSKQYVNGETDRGREIEIIQPGRTDNLGDSGEKRFWNPWAATRPTRR